MRDPIRLQDGIRVLGLPMTMTPNARPLADPTSTGPHSGSDRRDSGDIAGRDRLIQNVLSSWGSHLFFIASGFLVPRIVDRQVGQAALGIWDFGWSLVSYFALAQVGIGASGNRFVAKYRAVRDVAGVNRVVSTVTAIQITAGLLTSLCTLGLVGMLPVWFGDRLGVDVRTAQWVVGLLGTALAIEMAFDGFRGVVTGCHRWDIHNGLSAASHVVTTASMLIVLVITGDLRSLPAVYLLGMIGSETLRMLSAYHVCPELRIRPSLVSWTEAKELLAFGGKSMVDALSRLVLFQTNSLLVATYLGPAALAVYARPSALVRHAETLTNKFAFVLTPAASSLDSSGRVDDLRALVLDSTRAGAAIALPMLVGLAVMGDIIMQVWMGPSYSANNVLWFLSIGYLLPLITRPSLQVLVGMNRHGWIGLSGLAMAFAGAALGWLAIGPLGMGLSGAALAVGIPLTLGRGLFTAVYVCRNVGISPGRALGAIAAPVLCAIPFSAALWLGRTLFGPSAGRALLGAVLFGSLAIAPLYWHFIFPEQLRRKVRRRVLAFRRPAGRQECFVSASDRGADLKSPRSATQHSTEPGPRVI